MHSWNQGYVTDITYTRGYYSTLNPLRIKLCFLSQKLLPPTIKTACELGFGQGITLNFNATNPSIQWYGTDFNPSQAAFAKHLSTIAQTSLNVYDASFGELLERDDLPNFDFIALHGIYSWVSPKVREQILAFIQKKLNFGGVALISYNAQAGWASISPLGDLLRAYSSHLTPISKTSSMRAREGLNFINELMSLPSTEAIRNPQVSSLLQTLQKMDDTYLAHELLNGSQTAFNFLEISQDLEKAKLNFATYAEFGNHLINIQLSDQEKMLLSKVSHSRPIYEMLKDLMFATTFRNDYWVKGSVVLDNAQCLQELLQLRIVLTIPYTQANYTLNTRRGTLNLNEDFYKPILEILKSNEPIRVSEIKEHLQKTLGREIFYHELLESLIALSSKDYIKIAQEEKEIMQALQHTQKLNAHILQQALENHNYINHLVSPVTGEGVSLNRFELLFIYAYIHQGKKWIDFIADHLQKRDEKIVKDGKELSQDETRKEIQMQAEKIQEWIPTFEKLRIF